MDFKISGRVALVSGGSRGIGRCVAEMLAGEGCRVMIAARDQAAIDEAVAVIRAGGGLIDGISADMRTEAGVATAIAAARDRFGMPDIAINNVYGPVGGDLLGMDPEELVQSFRDVALSAVYLERAVVPSMKEKRWGRIISIGSNAAKEPPADLKHLFASTVRASVVSLNKAVSNDVAPFGITVNTIGTGWIATDRSTGYVDRLAAERGIDRDAVLAQVAKDIPMGRPGKPEEIAGTIAFLCSEQGGYITGTLIPLDGGIHRSAW